MREFADNTSCAQRRLVDALPCALSPMTDLPSIDVFDFDQTITHIHTGGCAMTEDEIGADYIHSNIKGGFVELMECLQQRGDRVYIATYGDDSFGRGFAGTTAGHALVQRYMDTVLGTGQQYFVASEDPPGNIIARCSNDGKHYHLECILAREGLDGNDPTVLRRILLLDARVGQEEVPAEADRRVVRSEAAPPHVDGPLRPAVLLLERLEHHLPGRKEPNRAKDACFL